MKKAILLTIAALVLAACNTVEGVGRDLEAAGGAVADTARDTKN
jgi:predicted small secreted protein